MNHQCSFSITIDFGGVSWLMDGLKSAAQHFRDKAFFSRYIASYAIFTMERYSNKNGSFTRRLEIRRGTIINVIIFPAGPKGNGWCGLADSLHHLIFSSSNPTITANYKDSMAATRQRKARPERKVNGQVSYADAVRNNYLENEEKRRGREKGVEARKGCPIDWKRAVVCIREICGTHGMAFSDL